MKKIFTVMISGLFVLSMAACSGNTEANGENVELNTSNEHINSTSGTAGNAAHPDNDQSDDGQAQTSATNNNGDMEKQFEELNYLQFELEVEYTDVDGEYETELKKRKDGTIKAKLDDTINNVQKLGSDAFTDIYPKIKGIDINQNTSKEEAIQKAIEAFGLPADYNEVELEITFKDGTIKEYDDKK